ncbi:YraN family protein [Nakamurella silvestris]|nr:YraN family protein [Nakamurella silvestris]
MAAKDVLGRRGEDLAAEFLESLGLVVLSRNWRCREGELDIVATDRVDTLVICEVKTRTGTGFGTPVEAVTYAKRRRLRRLAQLWLSQTGLRHATVRFDVVGVLWPPDAGPEIVHVPEAF